jgi:AcrR family transcriptional regulator
MDTRARILEAAAQLLASSDTGDVATRAVCEAAGVQQPVLYRIFGDKDGLLAATTDFVWEQYLDMKRSAAMSADPLEDLRSGWDSHTDFALQHPNAYKLLFSPALRAKPEAAEEAMRLLRAVLDRLARQGRLRVPVDDAARMIMAANTGVALALLLRPEMYPNRGLSPLVRDAVHTAVLHHDAPVEAPHEALVAAVGTLDAALPELIPDPLHPAEAALLGVWLSRLTR